MDNIIIQTLIRILQTKMNSKSTHATFMRAFSSNDLGLFRLALASSDGWRGEVARVVERSGPPPPPSTLSRVLLRLPLLVMCRHVPPWKEHIKEGSVHDNTHN